jgi:hypothetical protein
LLFEGTENIKRGEWFKIVTGNGGTNNTLTTVLIITKYSSNNLELGLWMEAERMMHPVINQLGLTPKTKLKKKRLRFDNSPYGQIIPEVKKRYSQITLIAGRLLAQWII